MYRTLGYDLVLEKGAAKPHWSFDVSQQIKRHKPRLTVPRVLIPTDEPNFTLGLVEGYRSLGWDVVTGAGNFKIRAAHYDAVHHQWPEEFTGWHLPNEKEIDQVSQHLQWWTSRSINIFSVNNIYPHNGMGHAAYHRLYSRFYEHCQLISHYSNTSRRMVLDEFPAARAARHVIHSPCKLRGDTRWPKAKRQSARRTGDPRQ